MDRININNYEAFFLDYHEGRLDSEEKQMVMAFLQEHPEFYDEFEDYANVVLPVPDIHYPDKSELFRTELSLPEATDWEFKCIEFMEGDLSDDELDDFEKERLSDPEKAEVLELYLATRSIPDESIVFKEKQALKKKVILIPRWIYGAVSAAAVLIISLIIFSPRSGDTDNPGIAEDTVREKIFYNKIDHPGKYEKIASVASYDKILLKSSLKTEEAENREEVSSYISERNSNMMASLDSKSPGIVITAREIFPPESSLFVYRYIPDAEDDEYQTLVAFSGDLIRKQLLGQDPELVKKTRFTVWELADAGLEKVSDIFGTGADIEREYNETGDLVAVSFQSALVDFNTPIKRRSGVRVD